MASDSFTSVTRDASVCQPLPPRTFFHLPSVTHVLSPPFRHAPLTPNPSRPPLLGVLRVKLFLLVSSALRSVFLFLPLRPMRHGRLFRHIRLLSDMAMSRYFSPVFSVFCPQLHSILHLRGPRHTWKSLDSPPRPSHSKLRRS